MIENIEKQTEVEEGTRENLISIAMAASLLAIPNVLDAKEVERMAGNAQAISQFQNTVKQAAKNDGKVFGGYSSLELANILARTIYQKGRSEGHTGRHHIATVLYNRAGKDRNKMAAVCFKKRAFSVWNKASPSTTSGSYAPGSYKICIPSTSLLNRAEEKAWMDAKSIASELVVGTFEPDGNYNAYYAPEKVTPSWSTSMTGTTEVGRHKFGYLTSEDPAKRIPIKLAKVKKVKKGVGKFQKTKGKKQNEE